MPLHVLQADITTLARDAIVNAAQPALLGGGGVDGAIHRVAGSELLEACRALEPVRAGVRCPTGEARITGGFALPARWVIHTVGPIWHGGTHGEAALLAQCYRASIQLLCDHGGRSAAFPAISCGVYGYPAQAAAGIAVRTLREALERHAELDITLCAYDEAMQRVLQTALNAA